MRSFIFMLSACGAIAQAAECQSAEETTMLQLKGMEGGMSIRKQRKATIQTVASKKLVQKLKHVAYNLDKMSSDDVDQALQDAADAIDTLPPAINTEVQALQNSVNDAAAAVEACHAEEGVTRRANAWEAAEAQSAVVASCEAELATLTADEAEICSDAAIAAAQSECACDEARVRRQDKAELCAAHTESYEFAYCEYSSLCQEFHSCHEAETAVYNQIVADVEEAMVPVVDAYVAAEQSACIMAEIQRGMANPPLNFDTIANCENQDTSHLVIVYPDLPAAPEDCHAPTAGSPPCASSADGSLEYIGCFVDDGSRDLGNMVGNNGNSGTNTFQLCRDRCGSTTYMSLQYGGECFCANAYATASQYAQRPDGECNAQNEPCKSNSFSCGGTWRNAVYRIN